MVHLITNPTTGPNGAYYYVKRVPRDLIAKIGKERYSISLRTKDPREAKRLWGKWTFRRIESSGRYAKDHSRRPSRYRGPCGAGLIYRGEISQIFSVLRCSTYLSKALGLQVFSAAFRTV